MKRWISLLTILALFFMYGIPANTEQHVLLYTDQPEFDGPNDSEYLQYIEDSVFASMEGELASDSYVIEEVCATYISREYLEEMEYYSRANIYFGYTLEDLDARFEGKRYIFTLGENKETTVKEFEAYSTAADMRRILMNVAIGTGVILVCVTVSILTAGEATPKVIQIIHAISYKAYSEAISDSSSMALIGAISALMTEMSESGDVGAALNAAAVTASEGFKWGAILGSVKGGIKETIGFATTEIPSWSESEARALELYGNKKATNTQVAFFEKEIVSRKTAGATIPDIVRDVDGHIEGIEVKNYDLRNNLSQLVREVKREVGERVKHMPDGSTQRLVLDVRRRGYPQHFTNSIREYIQEECMDIYPNLPVDFIWT